MFNDIHTGAPISAARVEEINARIAQVLAGIKKGKEIYHLTLENGGSLQEAEKASNEAAGGRFTTLIDNLCNEYILVSMASCLQHQITNRCVSMRSCLQCTLMLVTHS